MYKDKTELAAGYRQTKEEKMTLQASMRIGR